MGRFAQSKMAMACAVFGSGALLLTGCGAGDGSDGDAVTIDYLHRLPDGEGMTPVADIVAKWNADHPDIQVEATKFDGDASELALKLETDVNAGTGPCLAQVGYGEVPDLYVKGLLQDVRSEADRYKDNYSAGAYSLMNVGNTVVGLPQDTGPLVYYYNETAFEQLGVEVPTTMDELSEIAATAAAQEQYAAAFTPDEAQYWLSGQAAAAGDNWFTPNGEEWIVDTGGAGTQVVASFWQELIDDDEVLVQDRWGDGFTQALTDGSLIGHVGAAWEAGFLLDPLDGTDAEGQWRVAQLPAFGETGMTGPDGGSGVAVMKDCEYTEEAMAFNDWFNTQVDDLATQGLVVAATGAPETPEKMTRQFGGQDVFEEMNIANAALSPDFVYVPGFASLSAMNSTAAEAGDGSVPVSDIFDTARSTSVEALDNLGIAVADS
ncbi:ABC transporter substrate-binding protein [Nocardiopsis sp. JB363]|uniref:ABC transporter substrate-binding protein n=1 Tax=Nocardiopsis sp. JB363 TaxID=1434837 RepID=UPI00097A20B5|nr:extracellular solute-binding protein [Nocardiopsis sp. JB363]SIO85215.1 Predicted galacto-N-biose-/lacto-N-biose I ABC transporter, periplasmic substrate-binding protein [Nocardiopsis sp. JB363]